MMGSSHAVSGAAVWIAVTATALPALRLYPLSPTGVLLGASIAAGAALLADADHHNATIAHSVPILGRAATGTLERISGGHRHGMHSLLAVAGVIAATIGFALIRWTPTGWDRPVQIGSAIAVMACVAFGTKVLNLARSWPSAWFAGALAAVLVALVAPAEFAWLPICIGVGYVVHLIGDALTIEGVPLLWPFNPRPPAVIGKTPILNAMWKDNGYFAVPVLGHAGSWREWLLMLPVAGYVVWGVGATAWGLALQFIPQPIF